MAIAKINPIPPGIEINDPNESHPHSLSSSIQVDVHGVSHRGQIRPNNEDHFLVVRGGRYLEPLQGNLGVELLSRRFEEVFYGITVADGLGGHAKGEVASRRAIEAVLNDALDTPDWILKLGKTEINEVMWRTADRFIRAHAALLEEATHDPSLAGMSTTMASTLSLGDDLIHAHVGDSRIYILRDGQLRQLTRDHSLSQDLIESGKYGRHHPLVTELRHVLNQALGSKAIECHPDVQHLKLHDGDTVLVCTDGLTDMVDAEMIESTLKRNISARIASEGLLHLALKGGGKDNVTVVVARYSIPAQRGTTAA